MHLNANIYFFLEVWQYAICKNLQSTGKRGFCSGTHTQTHTQLAWRDDSVKIQLKVKRGMAFLDALVLMIETHSLTDSLEDWKLTVPQIPQISQISPLKMECHSKWNVIKNGKSLKMECHSK